MTGLTRLLAVSLTSPWMLAGLLLAGIPLLLHLLYRRRYREVSWAAVRFLSGAVRRNAQRHRLQQLLLLLIRTLAIIALVLAFARPLLTASFGPAAGAERTHHIFVIDGSLSMQYRDDQTRRFDRAVALVTEMVEACPAADAFHVVRLDYGKPAAVIPQAAYDRAAVRRELGQLECTSEREELAAALPELEQMLRQVPEIDRHTVYFLSDFQRSSWYRGRDDAGRLSEAFRRLDRSARIVCIDVGDDAAANVSVGRPEADRRFVKRGDTVTVRGVIQNSSRAAITDQPVRLLVDGRVAATEAVSVRGFSNAPVQFRHRFSSAGRHRVSIETQEDRLPQDNRVHTILNVFDRLPVLLVNGRTSGRPMGNATDYVQLSLAPGAAQLDQESPYRIRVIPEAALGSADLGEYAIVFLCNIRRFTTAEVGALQTYVRLGGALVVCLGDQVDQQSYNLRLLDEGGLMPVRLDGVAGNAERPEHAFVFDAARLDHPILHVYRGNPGHGLEQALTFQYIRARPLAGADVNIALALENGDPVIVESQLGDGTVVLVTIPGDDRKWSTWNTASGTFAALMNEVCEFAIAGRSGGLTATVGHRFERESGLAAETLAPTAALADGETITVRVEPTETGSLLVIDSIPAPGFLELRYQPNAASDLLACNVDERESDLRCLAEDELRARVLPGVDFEFRDSDTGLPSGAGTRSAAANDASFALVMLALLLLLVEQLLASRSRAGLWSLLLIGTTLFAAAMQPALNESTTIGLLCVAAVALLVLLLSRLRGTIATDA